MLIPRSCLLYGEGAHELALMAPAFIGIYRQPYSNNSLISLWIRQRPPATVTDQYSVDRNSGNDTI